VAYMAVAEVVVEALAEQPSAGIVNIRSLP